MRKKRGQNQGSVYQRGSDKRWVGQVTIQKKHHMRYFSTQPEAEAWVCQALLLIGQGLPLAGTRVSLAGKNNSIAQTEDPDPIRAGGQHPYPAQPGSSLSARIEGGSDPGIVSIEAPSWMRSSNTISHQRHLVSCPGGCCSLWAHFP